MKKKNFSLVTVFGVGESIEYLVLKSFGLSKFFSHIDFKPSLKEKIFVVLFCLKVSLRKDLKAELTARVSFLLNIKHSRALRLLVGLPVRGQRTKTNAKTAKKKLY